MKKIPLTQGQYAIVDDDDFEWLSQWKWTAQRAPQGYYAMRQITVSGRKEVIFMHRIINKTPKGMLTDHIDCDGLNNLKNNLRSATPLQNMMNRRGKRGGTSRFKGVWFDAGNGNKKNWRSAIRINGKLVYLGRFCTQEEASSAYGEAVEKYFGVFARA